MTINLYAESLESGLELFHGRLRIIARYDHAADKQSESAESIYQTQNIEVISYPQISAHLIFFYVARVYSDYNLRLVLKLSQHTYFTFGRKAGKHS